MRASGGEFLLRVFVASNDIADISEEIKLSKYRKNKVDATNNAAAKKERLAASVLLSYALKKSFGLDESEQEYVETELGKPYIPSCPNVCFNISHTDGYCAVAVSDAPVGIDIQRIEPVLSEGKRAIIRRFFSENRCCVDTPSVFFRLWTAKESIVKCTGEGISAGIRRYTVPFFFDSCRCEDMFLSALDTEAYAMTVCSLSDEKPILEQITDTDILRG